MRLRSKIGEFAEFNQNDLEMDAQEYENYRSIYIDLYEKIKHDIEAEKESILNDINFEIELLRTDKIDVDYILKLLEKEINKGEITDFTNIKDKISTSFNLPELYSKKELLLKFIETNMSGLSDEDDIEKKYSEFVAEEKEKDLETYAKENDIDKEGLERIIDEEIEDDITAKRSELAGISKTEIKLLEMDDFITATRKAINKIIDKYY